MSILSSRWAASVGYSKLVWLNRSGTDLVRGGSGGCGRARGEAVTASGRASPGDGGPRARGRRRRGGLDPDPGRVGRSTAEAVSCQLPAAAASLPVAYTHTHTHTPVTAVGESIKHLTVECYMVIYAPI